MAPWVMTIVLCDVASGICCNHKKGWPVLENDHSCEESQKEKIKKKRERRKEERTDHGDSLAVQSTDSTVLFEHAGPEPPLRVQRQMTHKELWRATGAWLRRWLSIQKLLRKGDVPLKT